MIRGKVGRACRVQRRVLQVTAAYRSNEKPSYWRVGKTLTTSKKRTDNEVEFVGDLSTRLNNLKEQRQLPSVVQSLGRYRQLLANGYRIKEEFDSIRQHNITICTGIQWCYLSLWAQERRREIFSRPSNAAWVV